MGVLGCSTYFAKTEQIQYADYSISSNFLYHGIDFVYTSISQLFAYDFKV